VVCTATAGTKIALGIIQLCFSYFAASFFKARGIHFSKEAEERYTSVVGAFAPVSRFLYGDDGLSLPVSVLFQNTSPHDR